MESLLLPDNENRPRSCLKNGLRADIWMYILDFICDLSLFTEIPRINNFFYRLSQSYPCFKTSLFLSAEFGVFANYTEALKQKRKSLFIHNKALNLLMSSHNLNSITFNISQPKNKAPRFEIELKELKNSVKRVNLIAQHYMHDRFKIKFMREAIELSIKCPNLNFTAVVLAARKFPNLKTIECESKFASIYNRSVHSYFKNITKLDLSIKVYDCPCFDFFAKSIIQNIIEGKVLKFFKGYGEYLRLTNDLASMIKEVQTLQTMKFKRFSMVETKINFVTSFLNVAAHSNLVSLSITSPIKSFLKRCRRNAEYTKFIDAVDYLLKNCRTLRHFRLTSFKRLPYRDIKKLSSIIIESIKSDQLETFNKLQIKNLANNKIKVFYIKYDIENYNTKLESLLFLILSEFIPKSNFLEKIVIYKHQVTEIIINTTISNIKSKSLFEFDQPNFYNLILLIIASKIRDLTSLNLNCPIEIYNKLATEFILSSSNLNHLKLTLQGDKNSKNIFSIVKANPFIFSKMIILIIDLKNEILTHATFSNIIISEILTSVSLKNFTVCLSENIQNTKKFTCLKKLEMINASFTQYSFDYILSLIKCLEILEIIRLEKCCVSHKKGILLETMQEINIKNSEEIINSLILKTNLKEVFVQINKNLDKERKDGFENIRGIEKIKENNKGIEKFDLVLPFNDVGLLEFKKLKENNKGIEKFDLVLPFNDVGLLEFKKLVS
ncbi:hypothetical protein SteCoe_11989 [Stentor coeruleus]|uniref:Uncharacterized protein n=1 Tax=Stentor coeruleus TaxID=5963 RepID=A0A1R2CBY9_9CILI|nr:hypothetical protein SteCoe_11989 [Stentor coeruleus]